MLATIAICSLLAALSNVVLDCDEIFNYWEPLHFLLYGYGLKPWEYHGDYALRPYAFLLLCYAPAKLMHMANLPKTAIYFLCKLVLSIANFGSLGLLLSTYGCSNAFAGLVAAPGIFAQAAAFLPNSTACVLAAAAVKCWKSQQIHRALLLFSSVTFLTWPYAILFYLPFLVFRQSKQGIVFSFQMRLYMLSALVSLIYVALPVLLVDCVFYGRPKLTWLNAVLYNVMGGNDTRFGKEAPLYYVFNGLVSYGFMFLIPFVAGTFESSIFAAGILLLSTREHKEERFVYALLPLMIAACSQFHRKHPRISRIMLVAQAMFMVTRLITVKVYYGGIENLFASYNYQYNDVVCFKDQWYRFPSHFFLPQTARVGFLDSMDFEGAIPQYYSRNNNAVYNNKNERSPTQFTNQSACTVFAGLRKEFGDVGIESAECTSIVDQSQTRAPFRWIYVPGGRHVQWNEFCLMRSKRSSAGEPG